MKRLLFISLLCFTACTDGSADKSPLEYFDQIGEASMKEVICLDSIEAFGVTDFAVQDRVLWLLFQRPGCDDVLARYGLDDKTYKSFIKRGRGPGEMITVSALDSSDGIALADCNTNRLTKVVRDTVVTRQLPAGSITSCARKGGSLLSTGIYSEGRYRLADLESGRVSYFGEYPRGGLQVGDEFLPTAYINSKIVLKPDGTRFVCINSNCGIVEINALEDDAVKPVERLVFHYPDVVGKQSGATPVAAFRKSNVNGFYDAACSDENIYAIYSGKTYDEAGLGIENCEYLITFEWSGKLIGCYRISPALSAIHFDNSNGVLYGLAHTPTRSLIYKLDI